MITIYIIRHGEAEGNIYGRCQGQYNSRLTKVGRAQAEALALRFKDIQVDAIYSSDLLRAMQTAEPMAAQKGLRIIPMKELRENAMGVWEDMPYTEVARLYPDVEKAMRDDPEHARHPGGEAISEIRDRMVEGFRRIIAENEGRTVAVFSHGHSLRLYLSQALHGDLMHQQLFRFPNTAVSLVTYENGLPTLHFTSDNTHLSPENGYHYHFNRRFNRDEGSLRFERAENRIGEFERLVNASGRYRLSEEQKKQIRSGELDAVFAFCNGSIVGFMLLDHRSSEGQIMMAWLSPDYRGRGLGPNLFGEAVSVFRNGGKKSMTAELLPTDERALKYAERFDLKVENGRFCFDIPSIALS